MIDTYYGIIQNRMSELGYTKFAVKPLVAKVTNGKKVIEAHNQYLFLVSDSVPAECVIESDTNLFSDWANYATFNFAYMQEFSGEVTITSSQSTFNLEFIQVIPEA